MDQGRFIFLVSSLLSMATLNQKQIRLQIIFLALIGITIPCYGLGYAFVSVNRKLQPTATSSFIRTSTSTPTVFKTGTPVQIIPTRFPTFTPTRTPTITPTRTDTPVPSDTPTPTGTPTPTATHTVTASPTETDPTP